MDKLTQQNETQTKIIHVTESLGGGVLNSLIGLIKNQVSAGFKTEIHYVERTDTPSVEELRRIIGKNTLLVSYGKSNLLNLAKLMYELRASSSLIRVIHLHSSKAGLLGRFMLRNNISIVLYTPHAFAFTRKDISAAIRTIYCLLEYLSDKASNCKTLGVSKHESSLAYKLKFRNVDTLYNYISDPILEFGLFLSPFDAREYDVCNLARISPQKNPGRFSRIFRIVQNPGKWVWIGEGQSNSMDKCPEIKITGWQTRGDSMRYLNNSKIFLSTSDWEGLSMSLIEAQMIGLPAIAWDLPSNREIIQNGETGYLCSTENEIAFRVQEILRDVKLWEYLSQNARRKAIINFERSENLDAWKNAYFD